MDGKIIMKIYPQPKQMNIFHQVFIMSTILSFESLENKHDAYRGKDCMKKFCESLKRALLEDK